MSDNAETTTTTTTTTTSPPVETTEQVVNSSSDNKTDAPTKSTFGDVNVSSPVRLFGQFIQNGTGTSNTPTPTFGQLSLKDKSGNNSLSSSTNNATSYFTSTLSKISSPSTSSFTSGGFGSSSAPLASSLAALGANKPLFGGSSNTITSSFTDLKTPAGTLQQGSNTQTMPLSTNSDHDDDDDAEDDEKQEQTNKTTPSLLETAAEYEAKRALTHSATTIQGDTSTGEEQEITKFQMAGKLYVYNGEQQTFVERGYGILKINECLDPSNWDRLQARLSLINRFESFSIHLLLRKWTVERASDRSVRFGAQDESHLRVFIIKATASDCANLCKELQSRIQIVERQHAATTAKSPTNTPPKNVPVVPDLVVLDDDSPYRNLPAAVRKRSHSQSDSDTSDNANDISKKSKGIDGHAKGNKDSTSEEDDSVESFKTGEQETSS